MDYVNPSKRKRMFNHIKLNMEKLFIERKGLIVKLSQLEPSHLTQKVIAQYNDDVRKIS